VDSAGQFDVGKFAGALDCLRAESHI
jgi:hypothetical protein